MMVLWGVIFICCILKIVVVSDTVIQKNTNTYEVDNENNTYKDLGENPLIRVLLMSENFINEYHKEVEIKGEIFQIYYGEDHKECTEVEEIHLTNDHEYFMEGSIIVKPSETNKLTITSLKRSYGNPEYAGELEIFSSPDGLVVINELELETYLKGVLPSEMPASYEMEALKAQAVCARSYAYKQMQVISYEAYEAHINDSVAFQVYNNLKEAETTNEAIYLTAGEKLGYEGEVVTTYFFSTSSGSTTDVRAWGSSLSHKNEYLKSISVSSKSGDYEMDLPWYKWSITLGTQELEEIFQLNISENIGTLNAVEILEVGAGNVVLKLEIKGQDGSVVLEGENTIRKALGSTSYTIVKNDNTSTQGMSLLPSAFFTIEEKGSNFIISGGGLGHGIGMSQNGANEMAKDGMEYIDILQTFYQNTEIIL